jgi:gamma-glutamyltranspeptidase/glutathione hydrolase
MCCFLRHVHHGLDLQEAMEAPAWHSTHFPSSFYPREAFPARIHVEERFGSQTISALTARGHDVVTEGPWSLGRMTAAGISAEGLYLAAATQRGQQGYATGR